MATIVADIIEQSLIIAAAELGATYQQLPFVFDVEKNSLRRVERGFGVRPLGAIPAETVVRSFTLDHDFEMILADSFGRADNDTQKLDKLEIMYDKADEIFKNMINKKLNLPSTVLLVSSPSLSAPELIDDNKMAILRMQYIVRYRSQIT